MDGNARWLFSDGNSAPTNQNFNIPPAVLYIALPFMSSDAGTYTCSPNNMLSDPSRDTIELIAGSEYVATYIFVINIQTATKYTQTHCSINVASM